MVSGKIILLLYVPTSEEQKHRKAEWHVVRDEFQAAPALQTAGHKNVNFLLIFYSSRFL